jgi:uncharacterized protein (DUF2141 family)
MKIRILSLALALLTLPLLAEAQLASLKVTVAGLNPAEGTVEVSLFNSEETYMQTPLVQQSLAVDGKEELTFEFAGLLEGDYAVVVVHDENDNGVLDTGFLGFGGESYAFSNNATTFLGRPSFESAHIVVGKDDVETVIDLD